MEHNYTAEDLRRNQQMKSINYKLRIRFKGGKPYLVVNKTEPNVIVTFQHFVANHFRLGIFIIQQQTYHKFYLD